VLTSSSCAKGAPVVRPAARGALPLGVAGVRRRGELALVQLTTARSGPLALIGSGKARAATVKGYHGRVRSVRGRSAACGTRFVCVRLARGVVPPSPSCENASGTALISAVRGRRLVTGIGLRARTGCARRPVLRFRVLDAGVLRWIVTVLQQTGARASVEPSASGGARVVIGPAPSSQAPEPGTPASDAPPLQGFVGTWAGEVDERPRPARIAYVATITIDRLGAVGEVVGRSRYAFQQGCGGELVFLGVAADGGRRFRERLTFGLERCFDAGTVTLAPVGGRRALTYSWEGTGVQGRADGVLEATG
jgi:hypothetical protein